MATFILPNEQRDDPRNPQTPAPVGVPVSTALPPTDGVVAPPLDPTLTGRDRAAAYFASKGVTPYATSLDSWQNYWDQWGHKDPAYFDKRLAQADEFTGKGPNYDWQAAGERDPGTTAAGAQLAALGDGGYNGGGSGPGTQEARQAMLAAFMRQFGGQ